VNPGSSNQPAVNQAEKTPALTGDNQILAYVPADAVGFVSVRFGDWWNGDLGKKVQQQLAQNNINPSQEMEKQTGLGPGDVDQVLTVLTAPAPTAYWTLVTTTKPIDLKKVWANLAPDAAPKDFQGKSYLLSPKNAVAFFLVNDHTLVLGPDPAIQQFIQRSPQPSASGPLSNALALAAAKHSIVAGVVPPPQFLDQAKKNMRGPIQGFEPVLELQSATLTADLGNDLDLELRATYPDDARAQKARDAARNAMGLIRGILVPQLESKLQGPENATFLQAAKPLEDALANIAIEQQGPAMDIHLQTQGGGLARVVDTTPAMIQKIRQASIRTVSQNNLKQLALAMHAYADLHEGKLPPAVVTSKDGKPLYSWRVEMLPFVEEAALYNEFHKDEPWDSPNNIKLLPRMPKVFAPVGTVQTPEPNSTFYQVLNGPGAIFDGSRQLPLTGIADGTSNTIMIVEAGEAVPWTKPADLPYQANGPLPKLGGLFPDGFNAAFADGAIYFISRTVSEKTLRALITAAAGDVPGPDFQTR
ncbi:MAG: DUF1559 domain-containing protein, partial [Planctomycetes bacterium]|nr:DUF1559 domain-containing protein [Planctomycetota bacterium]